MAEFSRQYNLRDTKKKPQGMLLKRWEVEYSNLLSNENRRIPLEKVKTAICSAFEDGMFEQWRITLKCPLSGQRIKVPTRYADCTHIECFDLETFLQMKTQKNLLVCPVCQKEVEKPLANLRIDRYIETVLSTMPDAMQVELLLDGSFTEVYEQFVAVTNVINDEEPYVQDNNAPAFEIKQQTLKDDDACITLSDGEGKSIDEIVEIKPVCLMPLNMDIKPKIAASSEPEQTNSGENLEILETLEDDDERITLSDGEEEFADEIVELKPIFLMPLNMDIKPKIDSSSEQNHFWEDREIQVNKASANVNTHSDRSSSEINLCSVSTEDENDQSRTMTTEKGRNRNPTTSTRNVLDVPSDSAQKMKITTIRINICYGTASFITSEGQEYDDLPLSDYVSILRGSEADVLGSQAHIVFDISPGGTVDKAEFPIQSVLGSRKKFKQFSEDIYSILHLWENGRISVELHQYSELLSLCDFCAELFCQDRSILKCQILEINWLDNSWPFSVITNVVNNCKQLILKIKQHPRQQLHNKFLDLLYEMTLPQHIDVTLEFNMDAYYFISELEKRFQGSNAQHFKFKLLFPGFPRNKLLRNDYGTLEMKMLTSHCDENGLRRYTVIIEQCPYSSNPDQQSI